MRNRLPSVASPCAAVAAVVAVMVAVMVAVSGCTATSAVQAEARSLDPPAAAASGSDVAVGSEEPAPAVVASSSALPAPLTILEIGDSLGEDLGFGLRNVLRNVAGVELVQAAKGNSGLVQPQYYDWPKRLLEMLNQYRPHIVVVFIGANDVQNFYADGSLQKFGTPGWEQAYAARVATLMQEATDAGAKVLWVGMPVMKSATFSSSMKKLNAIYQAQAALHAGVAYFPSWDVLSDSAGSYVTRTTVDGTSVALRTPDGIHITFGSGGPGADLLASAVVKATATLLAS